MTTSFHEPKTILVVGASRGLGFGLAREYLRRGWHIIATVRNQESANALHQLERQAHQKLEIENLDITFPEQISALRKLLEGKKIDLLFVNAGVANDPHETIGTVSTEEFSRVLITNTLSPLRVIEALEDLVPPGGTIAVMSSGLGSIADNEVGGWEVYRASKAALNSLIRSFAARSKAIPRTFLAVAPGWVRTEMGGPQASLEIETSIRGVAIAVEARSGKPGVAFINYLGATLRW